MDLPGYGFAKVSKAEREKWRALIEDYFKSCLENIRVVFLLIDSLVHTLPNIKKVAVPLEKHSPMLGHRDSSQTV